MIDRPDHVIGPVGEKLTIEALPPARSVRWTPHRKAEVVAAVHGGLLTIDEACAMYELSVEELTGWLRALELSGIAGLRVTRLQEYRGKFEKHDCY